MKKEKLEIIYSVGVIIAIPLLMAMNTILLVRSSLSAFNRELSRKADLVNAVIAESVEEDILNNNYTSLNERLQGLEENQPALVGTGIIQKQGDEYVVLAAGRTDITELEATSKVQIDIAYQRKAPVATFINIRHNNQAKQAWNVTTPALDGDGNVIGVIVSNTLTTDADEAINKAFMTSFIVLVISIVVIIILLFRHFRLVGNIQLLAKQKEINQTMSDFLSVATHELKAPTSIIKGYLSNVMDGTFGPINEQIQSQLQTAVGQTERLNTLVQDLLNVSRIEQGRIAYNITAVDSTKLLNMITENYKTMATAKGLELKLEATTAMPQVKADEGRVQEIFTNLIDNAIKYTAQGGVHITQRVEKNLVVTAIKDTGYGMDAEARKRLFQRFYRVQTEHTKDISGTGLGLWIIKQYILAMGGTIEVESLEGVGSTFIVALPI